MVGDPDNLAPEHLQLTLDRLVLEATLVVDQGGPPKGPGTTYGTAHPRSARTANSIVLIACSPCVPPAALIKPITLSCR